METLGKYALLEKLEDGIQGPVYRACDNSSHRNVMLITLGVDIPWDPAAKDHFTTECAAIRRLKHANLATVYEHGEDRKVTFLAAELLPGKDLRHWLAEKAATTLEWKIAFMAQVAAGLAYAHSQGVMHRCLRPAYIHMLPDGTAKVSGFGCGTIPGLAKLVPQNPAAGLYQSPEQLMGHEATAQSDVFSLGLIFYEFVTGVHPFHDADCSKSLDHILHQAQFPTVEQFPDLPFNLWPILERCLAKEAAERYPTMQDLGSACRGMLEELAEDSQCMRIELQTALPRLRKAARKLDAPPLLTKLLSDVEQALLVPHDSNYHSLNRLILALTEHHRLIDATAEAPGTSLPDPMESSLERVHPPASADIPPVEPPPGTQMQAAKAPGLCSTNGIQGTAGVSKSPPGKSQEIARKSAAEPASEGAAVKDPAHKAAEPAKNGCSAAQAIPAESTSSPATGNAKPPRSRTAPKDSFSELLKKIDQGQESTQKLVDSFLAGRQAKANGNRGPEGDVKRESTVGGTSPSATGVNSEPPPPVQAMQTSAPQAQEAGSLVQPADNQVSPVEKPLTASAKPSTAPPKPAHGRTILWICAAALLLALTFAIPGVRARIMAGMGKNAAQKVRMWLGGSQAQSQADDAMAIAVRDQLNFARRNVLLEEAEVLHTVGRREEALTFLSRLLELYPSYAPALKRLDRINQEINASSEDQLSPVQMLLAGAAATIKVGNLQKAKADLDAVERLQPGLPEAATLRKALDAKKAESERNAAREQEAQRAVKLKRESEASVLRAQELYRQGKYDDALAAVDEHAARYPTSTQVQEIRSRTVEMKQNLKSYETALSAGRLTEARAALEEIERVNPADPGLGAMRRLVESAPAPGNASLSVYPLAEPAVLVLDDQLSVTGGELVNHAIAAGRHKIVARDAQGQEVEVITELTNGQAITLVYDVPGNVLRAMNESDRVRIDRTRPRQQTQRFVVEHPHGILRGSCKGELIIDYNHVIYQPTSGSHGFSIPFKDLRLRIDSKTAVLLFAGNSTEFTSFKLADVASAQVLRRLWDDLSAPEK